MSEAAKRETERAAPHRHGASFYGLVFFRSFKASFCGLRVEKAHYSLRSPLLEKGARVDCYICYHRCSRPKIIVRKNGGCQVDEEK